MEAVLGDKPKSFNAVSETATSELQISSATSKRYVSRLKDAEVNCHTAGFIGLLTTGLTNKSAMRAHIL